MRNPLLGREHRFLLRAVLDTLGDIGGAPAAHTKQSSSCNRSMKKGSAATPVMAPDTRTKDPRSQKVE